MRVLRVKDDDPIELTYRDLNAGDVFYWKAWGLDWYRMKLDDGYCSLLTGARDTIQEVRSMATPAKGSDSEVVRVDGAFDPNA